jgi:hypothetical protein
MFMSCYDTYHGHCYLVHVDISLIFGLRIAKTLIV